jgi:hypothetical protein
MIAASNPDNNNARGHLATMPQNGRGKTELRGQARRLLFRVDPLSAGAARASDVQRVVRAITRSVSWANRHV